MHTDQVRGDLVVDELDLPEVFLDVSVDCVGEGPLRALRWYEPLVHRLMTEDSTPARLVHDDAA
jgi:hypothetical protein